MIEAMSDLEKYMNSDDNLDVHFLKQNRIEYYDRMTEVRNKGNYEQWVKFFLRAFYESGKDAIEAIDKLIDAGILVQTGKTSRNRTFAYADYLNIAQWYGVRLMIL